MVRIGTDIGGTFTDITLVDDDTGATRHVKVLTSAAQPAEAVLKALDQAGVPLEQATRFAHGTTIAINTIIERRGARTGILATAGFADVLELRRGARTHILDPLMDKPFVFVPGRWRRDVPERILADGTVERPLDVDALRAAVRELVDRGVESVAVCFLHAYAHPQHERQAGQVLAAEFPGLSCTLSSDVVPEIKEYERTSTAALNAYCRPVVSCYLSRLDTELRERGLTVDVDLMQSGGGTISAAEAARRPVQILESGPAAGAIAAARLGEELGLRDLITFDMGGTTAKSAVIEGGRPLLTVEFELFEEPDKPGSGWPVQVPMIDIVEVGAGGGSIAWLDEAGRLQVGPRSAGSEPGPVCYGHGGTQPTITDAHAVVGNLRELLGGEFPLDVAAARRAVGEHVAAPLGLTVEAAAAGILRIAGAKVADLIREVTIARGRDPRGFTLVAYGGAGPLEAAHVIAELEMPQAVVPPTPGTFSAAGLLDSDLVADAVRTYLRPLPAADREAVAARYAEMERELTARLAGQGVTPDRLSLLRTADLRYAGQFHQINVAFPASALVDGDLGDVARAFHAEHLRLYTYQSEHEELELVNLRVRAVGRVDHPRRPALPPGRARDARAGSRPVWFVDADAPVDCAVYDRRRLGAGAELAGPAVVEEETSVTLLPPGCRAEVHPTGSLLLRSAR